MVQRSLNNRRAKRNHVLIRILQYTVLTSVAVVLVFPFYWMVARSFMTRTDCDAMLVFPSHFIIGNYRNLFVEADYMKYFWNTVKIILFNIVAVPLSAALCAYSFSKLRWKGRNFVFACVLSTIMIPGAVIQIPIYSIFYSLGWIGTALPLTIPAMFGGGAINIFLLRQFMRGINNEIEDAAKVDGAGVARRCFQITLPLCLPILLYVMVGAFASAWSDFYSPLIYLTGHEEKYTLAVAIYQELNGNSIGVGSGPKMAAGTFMALLPTLVFVLYQRRLVDGITVGAIKG